MPIDIHSETLLTLNEARAILPGRPDIGTLHRWRTRGLRGVKLETVLLGKRYTSREALQRFSEKTTAKADGVTVTMKPSARRAAEQAAARKELRAAGLMD